MSRVAYLAGALFLLPTVALAGTPAAQPIVPAPAANAKPDGEKIICESQDTIGSRLQDRRVCMTKDQWTAFRREEQDKVADMQGRTQARPSN